MALVMKFGGSSVADAACMRQVAALVGRAAEQQPLVVLSAMGKTTNALFECAQVAEAGDLERAFALVKALRGKHRQAIVELFDDAPEELSDQVDELFAEVETLLRGIAILGELSPRSLDAVVSAGERLSTRIFAAYARLPWIDARTMMRTDSTFGNAAPLPDQLATLVPRIVNETRGSAPAAVTQGYIGADAHGHTTTLGRGGSDYSAALFAAALGAPEVQIWTDVEGLLTCDPRMVPTAVSVDELTAAEAAELAAFGAKVLHPATIQPAVDAGAVVTIRDTQRPEGAFTTIAPDTSTGRPATALATRGPVTMLTINSNRMLNQPGFLARLFDVFRVHELSVGLIATAEVSVSLTLDDTSTLDAVIADIADFGDVTVLEDRAIVALVGERLKATKGMAKAYFEALSGVNIEMISQGANEINMSVVVAAADAPGALRALHHRFFEVPA